MIPGSNGLKPPVLAQRSFLKSGRIWSNDSPAFLLILSFGFVLPCFFYDLQLFSNNKIIISIPIIWTLIMLICHQTDVIILIHILITEITLILLVINIISACFTAGSWLFTQFSLSISRPLQGPVALHSVAVRSMCSWQLFS